MAIRFGVGGERFGHEADFDDGLNTGGVERIEDVVEDRPVVNRFAVFVLGVGVSRAPLEGGGAVAGGQQIVDADVHGRSTERGQLAEKFLAVRRVGVVGLIVAEVVPDWAEGACGLIGVHMDRYAVGSLLREGRWSPQQIQCSGGKDACEEFFHWLP